MRKGFTLIELMIVVAIIAIIAAIAIPSLLRSRIAANETAAIGGLKQITSHQASFMQTDADGNGVKDYWTYDVAGFYAIEDAAGNKVKYIDVVFACSDANDDPLGTVSAAMYGGWAAPAAAAKSGYWNRAMVNDASPAVAVVYAQDPDLDTFFTTNGSIYGFCAYPKDYGTDGMRIFMVNQEGVIYGVDGGEIAATGEGDYLNIAATGCDWPDSEPTSVQHIVSLRNFSVAN